MIFKRILYDKGNVIRRYRRLTVLWYESSIIAHDFIAKEFWHSKKPAMRTLYLPNGEVWVYEKEGRVVAFVACTDNVIAALFVMIAFQAQGIGTKLLKFLKDKYEKLALSVYKENKRAINFILVKVFP